MTLLDCYEVLQGHLLPTTMAILFFSVITEHQIQLGCQRLWFKPRDPLHVYLFPFVELQFIHNTLLNSILSATDVSKNNKTSTPQTSAHLHNQEDEYLKGNVLKHIWIMFHSWSILISLFGWASWSIDFSSVQTIMTHFVLTEELNVEKIKN